VRVELIDLGVVPEFGPEGGLSLQDGNAAIGIVGRD
jgi:hypothetical protein